MSASKRQKRSHGRVRLNVGGTLFETSTSTLTGASNYFAAMLSRWEGTTEEDDDEGIFLDRDPDAFKVLLSCMRYGTATLPEADPDLCARAMLEAEFLGMERLILQVKAVAWRNLHPDDARLLPERHQPDADPTPVTDVQCAGWFDEEFACMEAAIRSRVPPGRFFSPASKGLQRVKQIIPASGQDAVVVDDDDTCRVMCYALLEDDHAQTRIEPVLARTGDIEGDEKQLMLASEWVEELGAEQWMMKEHGTEPEYEVFALKMEGHPMGRAAEIAQAARDGWKAVQVFTEEGGSEPSVLMERNTAL